MAKSKGDHLEELQKKIDYIEKNNKKSVKIRKRLIALLLCIGSIAGVFLGSFFMKSENEKKLKEYETNPDNISFSLLGNEEVYNVWNADNGNDINTILSGGAIYSHDNIQVFPGEEANVYSVVLKGNEETKFNINRSISYINLAQNTLFYRDSETRQIFRYDIEKQNEELFVDDNVGEVLIFKDRVYYTSFNAGGLLFSVDLTGKEKESIGTTPMTSFAVCGKYIMYLGYDMTLCVYNTESEEEEVSATNIERFFLSNNIVAERDNAIISISYSGQHESNVLEMTNLDSALVCVRDTAIYYREDGKLNCGELGSESKEILSGQYDHFESMSFEEDGTIHLIAVEDNADKQVSMKFITLSPES